MAPKHVLLVDDDENITNAIPKVLKRLGCDVFAARNGLEGLEILEQQNDLDMIITDIRMPGMDGNDFARYIHNSSEYRDIPVVAITGYSDEAEENLFTCVLLKPFKIQDLAKVIGVFP